jgi:hypothetical protein
MLTKDGILITLGNLDTTFEENPPGFSSKIGSLSVSYSKTSLKSFSQFFIKLSVS